MSRKTRLRQQQQAVSQASPQGQRATLIAQKTEIRQAPIPDPDELRGYKELDPDLFDLIKSEYAKNGEHRRQIEREFSATQQTLIKGITRNDTLGIAASWSFAVICVSGAFYFMSKGQPIGGLLGVLGVLPPVIAAFRRGGRRKPA